MGSQQSATNSLYDDTDDSLVQADIVKQSQRTHEMEVSLGGEADLHKHKKNCKKDPSHKNFIPANKFTISDLPWRYRYPEVLDLIKALSDLTVRVGVQYTSPERPQCYPNSDIPYPFSIYRGQEFLRTGTGSVTSVVRIDGDENDHCPCKNCLLSDDPMMVWCHLDVLTATHVVYNDEEAQHSKCKVDYLTDESPEIVLEGIRAQGDEEFDKCCLTCVSHNLSLVDKFTKLLETFADQCNKVSGIFSSKDKFEELVVIPSHPHGCPKQISVGSWTKRFEMVDAYYSPFTYNASTCPGSSGAPLFIMARDVSWWTHTFIHSGANKEGNHCGGTWNA